MKSTVDIFRDFTYKPVLYKVCRYGSFNCLAAVSNLQSSCNQETKTPVALTKYHPFILHKNYATIVHFSKHTGLYYDTRLRFLRQCDDAYHTHTHTHSSHINITNVIN